LSRIDKSKPLKDQYLALAVEAEIETPEVLALPPPANTNDVNPDFENPYPHQPEGGIQPPSTDNCDCPFDPDPPKVVELPVVNTSDIFRHKLGEAVLPTRLLAPFLALFPPGFAHQVQQIANVHAEVDNSMRHVVIYDSYENLKKFERQI
jgi:hypothetical protein